MIIERPYLNLKISIEKYSLSIMNKNIPDIFIDLSSNSFNDEATDTEDGQIYINSANPKSDSSLNNLSFQGNMQNANSKSMPKILILPRSKIEINNKRRYSYPNKNIQFEKYSPEIFKTKPNNLNFDSSKTQNESTSISKTKPEPVDHIDPEFYLDLSFVYTEGFDSDNDSSRMPPNLRDMVTDPKGSPVYLALCGVDISGYNKAAIENAIYMLKYYQKECILQGFIQDSAYIEDIITSTLAQARELEKFDVPSLGDAEDQLDDALAQLEKKEAKWKNIDSQINASEQLVLNELHLKHQNDLENLNIEWNSESKLNQFNKPSKKLIELRMAAKTMMKQHRFSESAQVFNLIAKQEKKEQDDASRKMQEAYKLAQQRLEKQYQRDVESAKLQFEKKRNAIQMKKKVSLTPLDKRVSKCEQTVDKRLEVEKKLEKRERRSRANSSFAMNADSSVYSTCADSYYQNRAASRLSIKAPKNSNQKLRLPPIKPIMKMPLSNFNSRPITSNKHILKQKGKNTPHISRPDSRMAMRPVSQSRNMY